MNDDIEMIRSICKDLYLITGIKAGVYDVNFQPIYVHSKTMGSFCNEVRKDTERKERCLECDRKGFEMCKNSGQITIYRCHMGLTEVITPIAEKGVSSGYIMFGQLLAAGEKADVLARVKEIDEMDSLCYKVESMRETDEATMRAAARLVSMCANYIQLLNILAPVREMQEIQIRQYIQNHLGDSKLSVQSICSAFSMSRGTLYNISVRAFGMGITRYVQTLRIEQAMEWIQNTDMPMYEISEKCGFAGADYLTRLIRQRLSETPREIRKKSKALRAAHNNDK